MLGEGIKILPREHFCSLRIAKSAKQIASLLQYVFKNFVSFPLPQGVNQTKCLV